MRKILLGLLLCCALLAGGIWWIGPARALLSVAAFALYTTSSVTLTWNEAVFSSGFLNFKEINLSSPDGSGVSLKSGIFDFSPITGGEGYQIALQAKNARILLAKSETQEVAAELKIEDLLPPIFDAAQFLKEIRIEVEEATINPADNLTFSASDLQIRRTAAQLLLTSSLKVSSPKFWMLGETALSCEASRESGQCSAERTKILVEPPVDSGISTVTLSGQGSISADDKGYRYDAELKSTDGDLGLTLTNQSALPKVVITSSLELIQKIFSRQLAQVEIFFQGGTVEAVVSPGAEDSGRIATVSLKARNLSGTVPGAAIERGEIAGDLHITAEKGSITLQGDPLIVSKATLDTGVQLENVTSHLMFSYSFGAKRSRIFFRDISFSLLGGEVKSEKWEIHFPLEGCYESRWSISDLSLAKVEELYGTANLNAEGLLSGQIPLSICKDGAASSGGKLIADPPSGSISYVMDEKVVADSNALEITAKALKDFQFTKMEVGSNYQKSGLLNLAITLEGKSRGLNTNAPINVNLNIEESIPQLLRSLRISEGVAEGVRSGKLR